MTKLHSGITPKQRAFAERKAYEQKIWDEYQGKFPTEADKWSELARIDDKDKHPICRLCGTTDPMMSFTARTGRCRSCKKVTSFTAGTFFHGIRVVDAWLGSIYMMERGIALSSSRLSELAGISQSAAHHILAKLRMVIEKNMEEDALEVNSSDLSPVVCKRSRETPARCHPQEEDTTAGATASTGGGTGGSSSGTSCGTSCGSTSGSSSTGATGAPTTGAHAGATGAFAQARPDGATGTVPHVVNAAASCTTSDAEKPAAAINALNDIQRAVYEALSSESMTVDDLCRRASLPADEIASALTILEVEGLISAVGGKFTRLNLPPKNVKNASNDPASLLANMAQSIRSKFHSDGDSRGVHDGERSPSDYISNFINDFLNDSTNSSINNSTNNSTNNSASSFKHHSDSSLGGGAPGLAEASAVERLVGGFFDYVRSYHHGVARKYLQPYVAAYWCHTARGRWGVDRLKIACFNARWITDADVLAYVTKPAVKLFDWLATYPNMSNQNEAPLPGGLMTPM